MLVKHRMTPNPITIPPDATVPDALKLTRERRINYLPIVNKKGKLIGIVSRNDLMQAAPSKATTLSVFEANYLLAHLEVEEIMNKPITVLEDTPLEEAARLMVENGIGCLPVMRDKDLVGIITETDIFKAFAEILGGGARCARRAGPTDRRDRQPGGKPSLRGCLQRRRSGARLFHFPSGRRGQGDSDPSTEKGGRGGRSRRAL
jgi:CBS domain-containing protein